MSIDRLASLDWPTQSLCVVGPGRHSPVLGAITEHVLAALQPGWQLSAVQVSVPGDPHDSTLIGLSAPRLVAVPSLMETAVQSGLTAGRRIRRFFVRERPDVIMFELWAVGQLPLLVAVLDAAGAVGIPVVVRVCGVVEATNQLVARRLRATFARCALVITSGSTPSVLDQEQCEVWQLPEWRIEERQVDADRMPVVAFLPAADSGEAGLMLSSLDGLSDSRVGRYSLRLVRRLSEDGSDASAHGILDSAHHRAYASFEQRWMTDLELDRCVHDAGVVVLFDPEQKSRVLEAASYHGIPIVIVRSGHGVGPGADYSGASVCSPDPSSVLSAVERADLARRLRHPRSADWKAGAARLSERLAQIATVSSRSVSAGSREAITT